MRFSILLSSHDSCQHSLPEPPRYPRQHRAGTALWMCLATAAGAQVGRITSKFQLKDWIAQLVLSCVITLILETKEIVLLMWIHHLRSVLPQSIAVHEWFSKLAYNAEVWFFSEVSIKAQCCIKTVFPSHCHAVLLCEILKSSFCRQAGNNCNISLSTRSHHKDEAQKAYMRRCHLWRIDCSSLIC